MVWGARHAPACRSSRKSSAHFCRRAQKFKVNSFVSLLLFNNFRRNMIGSVLKSDRGGYNDARSKFTSFRKVPFVCRSSSSVATFTFDNLATVSAPINLKSANKGLKDACFFLRQSLYQMHFDVSLNQKANLGFLGNRGSGRVPSNFQNCQWTRRVRICHVLIFVQRYSRISRLWQFRRVLR